MDEPSPQERAIRAFETLHRMWVCVRDLTGTLAPSLDADRFRHRNPLCSSVKNAGFESACLAFDVTRLHRDLPHLGEGRIQICHAGLVELVIAERGIRGIDWIIFAGGRRPGHLGEVATARPSGAAEAVRSLSLPTIDRAEAERLLEALHHLSARLVQLSAGHPLPPGGSPATTRRAVILRFIAEHHGEDLTLAHLGRILGLSPNRASTATRAACGEGFSNLLRKTRLATAVDLLHLTDLPVADVALRSGFNDLSGFFRTFRAAHGCTPRSWRQARRGDRHPTEA